MNNCGQRFRSEVATFRFLNQLIKVVTAKVPKVPPSFHSFIFIPSSLIVAAESFWLLHRSSCSGCPGSFQLWFSIGGGVK